VTIQASLGRLSAWSEEPCVSVYLPVERGESANTVATSLLSAARDAERSLIRQFRMNERDAAAVVAPLRDLADSRVEVGTMPSIGLFCRGGDVEHCAVPRHFEGPFVSVMRHPNVLAMVAGAQRDIDHAVLGLNRKHTRALRGGAFAHEALEVHMPTEGDLAVSHQRGLAHHGGRKGAGAIVGGSGSNEHLDDALLAAFMREIDRSLFQKLDSRDLPVVVVGVEYEVSAFKAASTQRNLLLHPCGSTERMSDAELHAAGQHRMWKYADQRVQSALERLRDLGGTPRVQAGPKVIQTDANKGRVDTLYVPERLVAATDDDESAAAAGASLATLQHRGLVWIVPDQDLARTTALLRF
jgi:Bacterial archaeo-eukaryotic release factor family 3